MERSERTVHKCRDQKLLCALRRSEQYMTQSQNVHACGFFANRSVRCDAPKKYQELQRAVDVPGPTKMSTSIIHARPGWVLH